LPLFSFSAERQAEANDKRQVQGKKLKITDKKHSRFAKA